MSESGSAPTTAKRISRPSTNEALPLARALDDVRGGDQEAVGGDDDGAAAAHRRAPAAHAPRDAQVGDARGEVAGDGGDDARVGVERLVVGGALFGR